ncbi:MAG: F0F1 ATP synthase subunit B [Verrucomicrobia bacterium]|nr:F0F1 ATP synthase subunit B [Verrucomicrobiota bacterium]MCX6959512.1 F0F1 ATP synthase subunit B [Verrucomicrobiota bacterium]
MEILKQFGVDWPHFIAQLVLFLIVYFVLNRFAFAPLLKVLEERRKRIEEGQLNAEKIKKQLAEAELRYQEVLRKANDDAQHMVEESRKNNEAFSQREMEKAVKESAAIVERARHEITSERNRMVDEVKNEMISLVIKTTAKVAGKVLSPEDQKRLSEEAAKNLAA